MGYYDEKGKWHPFGSSPVKDAYWVTANPKDGVVTPEMIARMRRCPCDQCQKEAREMEDLMLRNFLISTAVPSCCPENRID